MSDNQPLPQLVAKLAEPAPPPAKTLEFERALGAYKAILTCTFYSALVVIGAIILITFPVYLLRLYFSIENIEPPLLFVVIFSGSLGALFSALVRLYRLDDLPKALLSSEVINLKRRQLFIYSLSSPVIGCVAAAVIYVVFAGGLVQGGIFPAFACKTATKTCLTFYDFLESWSPASAPDYGKALAWGFAAGFAERMVPDALTKLSGNLVTKVSSA